MINENDFDFAFSFAGEDREIVEKIYNRLETEGIRVFYDNAYESELVGKDLYSTLRNLYKNQAKFIVCFISEYYAKKIWTNLEFTAVKERFISTFFASDFLIPIIIGDTDILEDIPTFVGYYVYQSIDETVEMLNRKINSSIQEDHLITNVNKGINYICSQIYKNLKTKANVVMIEENQIIVSYDGQMITYLFSSDTVSQTPCILVKKGIGKINHQDFDIELFPSIIITWEKNDYLLFSIHEFNSVVSRPKNKQSLSETIKYISSIVEKETGGIIY